MLTTPDTLLDECADAVNDIFVSYDLNAVDPYYALETGIFNCASAALIACAHLSLEGHEPEFAAHRRHGQWSDFRNGRIRHALALLRDPRYQIIPGIEMSPELIAEGKIVEVTQHTLGQLMDYKSSAPQLGYQSYWVQARLEPDPTFDFESFKKLVKAKL